MRAWRAVLLALACAGANAQPSADHHQHVFSPALAQQFSLGSGGIPPIFARDVIPLLDAAGIRQAVLLSTAYTWSRPTWRIEDDEARVRADNDFTGEQAALYPGRLVAFCGVNPLKDHALREIERCAADPRLARGIKLHFGNSDVQLDNPDHLARLQALFRSANAKRMAIVVHLRASISQKRPYGEAQARIFIEQLLPQAPDVVVQVAHLAGSGPGYEDPPAQEVMEVLARARQTGDPRTRNLWFDLTSVVNPGIAPATAALIAARVRQVGLDRVLYGSDAALGGNLRPAEGWTALRQLPLTTEELARLAANRAPYLEPGGR
jgi:predicted TIM-barrel fold metal-dependent hydrolase